tara:strand:+ start:2862 stop:4706 length:1845 start_codon:yes stop_codon:yes gene_type:complete
MSGGSTNSPVSHSINTHTPIKYDDDYDKKHVSFHIKELINITGKYLKTNKERAKAIVDTIVENNIRVFGLTDLNIELHNAILDYCKNGFRCSKFDEKYYRNEKTKYSVFYLKFSDIVWSEEGHTHDSGVCIYYFGDGDLYDIHLNQLGTNVGEIKTVCKVEIKNDSLDYVNGHYLNLYLDSGRSEIEDLDELKKLNLYEHNKHTYAMGDWNLTTDRPHKIIKQIAGTCGDNWFANIGWRDRITCNKQRTWMQLQLKKADKEDKCWKDFIIGFVSDKEVNPIKDLTLNNRFIPNRNHFSDHFFVHRGHIATFNCLSAVESGFEFVSTQTQTLSDFHRKYWTENNNIKIITDNLSKVNITIDANTNQININSDSVFSQGLNNFELFLKKFDKNMTCNTFISDNFKIVSDHNGKKRTEKKPIFQGFKKANLVLPDLIFYNHISNLDLKCGNVNVGSTPEPLTGVNRAIEIIIEILKSSPPSPLPSPHGKYADLPKNLFNKWIKVWIDCFNIFQRDEIQQSNGILSDNVIVKKAYAEDIIKQSEINKKSKLTTSPISHEEMIIRATQLKLFCLILFGYHQMVILYNTTNPIHKQAYMDILNLKKLNKTPVSPTPQTSS